MKDSVVGKPLSRVDGRLKVTGKAVYSAEVPVDGVAYAVIVGSAIARGKIKSIDAARASRIPGVLAIISHQKPPLVPKPGKSSEGGTDRVLQVLQNDEVLYSGQPVALVVADTFERAREAAQLVQIAYDAATPTVDFAIGAERNTFIPGKKEEADIGRGDAVTAFDRAEVKLDQVYSTPVETHNPMEMHATTAVWPSDKKLTLYDSTQGISECKRKVAATLGLDPADVRILSPYVGGGFGSKGSVWSHVILAAVAAREVKRPVKLVVARQQMFDFVGHRPDTRQQLQIGMSKDGVLQAIRHQVVASTSSFDLFQEKATAPTLETYACPNVGTSLRLTRLDVGTPQFMRAPGESTGSFAMESALDELSYQLGIDPIALRLKNHADVNPQTNKPWTSKSLKQCYALGAQRFGWSKRRPVPGSQKDGDLLVGYGMATATYPAHVGPASVRARVNADGSALVEAGTQDIGTGTYTVMTQVAADALGLPFEKVKFELGDSDMPPTPTSGGSTTAATVGSAVKNACEALRQQIIEAAVADDKSPLSGLDPKSVTVRDGVLTSGGKSESYAQVLARRPNGEMEHEQATPAQHLTEFGARSFGAQFAEVRVDPLLGTVRVVRFLGVYAAGKILNAKTARSQFLGGQVWGVGMALHEHTAMDKRSGRFVTRDLADYHVPVNADIGDFDALTVEEDDPHINAAGVKGIGEIGITGAAAAVANAVFHATGKRIRDLPITPDRLL
jgi:xanthine dehydrogenase YagR molybdenum-binding subunit